MQIDIKKIFSDYFMEISELIPRIITAVIILIVFIILGRLFYSVLGKRIQKKWKDSIVSSFIAECTKWIFYIFGIIISLSILGFQGVAGSLLAGAGISAIIFGFAFKDIGENFLAGIILALKRPFEIGDIIEIDGLKGTVEDLDLRTTHLRNVEGKDIYIPNSDVIKNAVVNYTKDGFFRINFVIGIAPESDIRETQRLILDYLDEQKLILTSPSPNVIVQELGEFTTNLQVLYWINILENKKHPDSSLGHNIRSKTIIDIKQILDDNHIEMPSQVVEHKMYRDQSFIVKNKQ